MDSAGVAGYVWIETVCCDPRFNVKEESQWHSTPAESHFSSESPEHCSASAVSKPSKAPLSRGQQRLAEFLRRARSTTTPTELKALSFDLGTATEEAMRENDFSTAMQLATLAVESARKSGNQHATTLANANKAKVSLAVKEFRSVARQLETLKRNPQDPEANFEVGRFTCLAKDDWDAGLRMLARGSDPRYRGLALLEISKPTQFRQQLALAKGWSELAGAETPPEKAALHARAYRWAQEALIRGNGGERTAVLALMDQMPIRYLADLEELETNPGPWPLGKRGDRGNGQRITVNGVPYGNGLGLHPPDSGFASVKYQLDGKYETFSSGVAVADHQFEVRGKLVFWVLGDGRVLWKSPPISSWGDALYCTVSVKNVRVLELRTQAEGSAFGANAAWLDPHLSR